MLRKLKVLLVCGVICLLVAAPAFSYGPYTTIEAYEKATGNKIEKFNEAPELRIKVAAGELPPVEQRISEEPLVMEPLEEIGQYGGIWKRVALSVGDAGLFSCTLTYESIIRWSPNVDKLVPNVAKKWEVSDGGRVFTFYLRKGMKWSDGEPYTADDLMFWYEDILLNKELTPSPPSRLKLGDELVKVEKVDDYTVRFSFSQPVGLFLDQLGFIGHEQTYPKHYLKNFHPRYTSKEKLTELAKKKGYDYWYQLFREKDKWYNPDLPVIWAWKIAAPPTTTRVVIERNPYYWKIDPAGNQLPYLDGIIYDLVQSSETLDLKVMSGEVDMMSRHLSWKNYTLYMENREKGDYRVLKWRDSELVRVSYLPQVTHKDKVLAGLLSDKRFRLALSLAIDREEINELVFKGAGKPMVAALPVGTPADIVELAKSYSRYDPKAANALLDKMGLTKRDQAGYRLRPDGKTLFLGIYLFEEPDWIDTSELVKDCWEAIGIKTEVKVLPRELLEPRMMSAQADIVAWSRGQIFTPYLSAGSLIPSRERIAATMNWYWWRTGGEKGEKSIGDMLKAEQLWDKIEATVDPEERKKLLDEVVRLHVENVWYIGIVGDIPAVCVAKNNFRNVPEVAPTGWYWKHPGNTAPEQFFIKK